MLAARIISIVIGYLFGLFQTGYLYGKTQGIDLRKEGSGNSGSTNSLRVLGIKAGAITLIGDIGKAVLCIVAVHFLFKGRFPDTVKLLEVYAGAGVVLGHNFPFYMKFRGGKGIASTAGTLISVLPMAIPVSLVVFVGVAAATRYVSLSSILMLVSYFVQVIVFGQMGYVPLEGAALYEFYIVNAFICILGIVRHHANINRLIHGTENKLKFHK